jgi:aldehyde dehydrogenase (NAD+)
VAASGNLTPVATELGGKSANLVFADADLDAAAVLAAFRGPLGQSGQSCACGSRILVQETVYEAFMEKFVAVVEGASISDPFDPAVMVGPVITEGAVDRILGVIDQAVDQKMGELVTGGRRIAGDMKDGYYIDADGLRRRRQRHGAGRDRDVRARGLGHAVHRGVRGSRHRQRHQPRPQCLPQTTNLTRAHRVVRQLEAGSVWVNSGSDIAPQGPYGGYKQSGAGRAGGVEGLREFQQVKNIRIAMGSDPTP